MFLVLRQIQICLYGANLNRDLSGNWRVGVRAVVPPYAFRFPFGNLERVIGTCLFQIEESFLKLECIT